MRFIFGVIIGLLIFPTAFYFYCRNGYAPVATAATPFPFERRLAHLALDARIDKEAPKHEPFEPSDADYQNGAHLYMTHCAVCHGSMDQAKTATAKGMFPKPPELLVGKGVTDDSPGETYWKVSNGIRLSGMPAYGSSLSDKEMWQISLLLARADKLPADVQAILKQPLAAQ